MKHFVNLPDIEFTPDDLDSATMKNLFYVLKLNVQDSEIVDLYNITGVKRIENISYELYGTTDYWWIIAKMNNINDIIFDLPISEEVLQQLAMDETLEQYEAIDDEGAMEYYVEQFEILVEENDSKRHLNVINPSAIGSVITEIAKSL